MPSCFECDLVLMPDSLHQCFDCGSFFCIDHIQQKEISGEYLCILCEMEYTSGYYHEKEKYIHPRFIEQLGNLT